MLVAIYLIIGTISFCLLVLVLALFGRLIVFQFKRWVLKNRGFVEVEHISETGVRNYYIMRPDNMKFDLSGGFYHYIPESITKTGEIVHEYKGFSLRKTRVPDPKKFEKLSDEQKDAFWSSYEKDNKKLAAEWDAEKAQLEGLGKLLGDLRFKQEAMTMRYGMPVITYYGDRPDPVLFRELNKEYGAGVIRDMFLRLLFTQRYEDFKKIIMGVAIVGGVMALGIMLLWFLMNGVVTNNALLAQTNGQLAVSQAQCASTLGSFLNKSATIAAQNSTMIV